MKILDPRLAWGHLNGKTYVRSDGSFNVDGTFIEHIWEPDIFFVDEKGFGIVMI